MPSVESFLSSGLFRLALALFCWPAVTRARGFGENCVDRRSMQGACDTFLDERDGIIKEYSCMASVPGGTHDVCLPPKQRGETCRSYHGNRECDKGLVCTGRCVLAAGFGEPCAETGISDEYEVCGSQFLCVDGICQNPLSTGDFCGSDSNYGYRLCSSDHTCLGGGSPFCTPRGEMGAVCNSNQDCTMDLRCGSFLCTHLVEEDGDCNRDSDCSGSMRCIGFLCLPSSNAGSNIAPTPSTQTNATPPTSPTRPTQPTIVVVPTTDNGNSAPTSFGRKPFNFVVGGGVVAVVVAVVILCRMMGCNNNAAKPSFISHTGQDQEGADFASQLYTELRKQHRQQQRHFVDYVSLSPGDVWLPEILRAIKQCQVFVAVITPQYYFRFACMKELDAAVQQRKFIIPVLLDRAGHYPDFRSPSFVQRFATEHLAKDPNLSCNDLNQWLNSLDYIRSITRTQRSNRKDSFPRLIQDVCKAMTRNVTTSQRAVQSDLVLTQELYSYLLALQLSLRTREANGHDADQVDISF